jgi:hypothetical protein
MAFTGGITKCYKLYSITVLCIEKAAYTLFMGKFTTFPMTVLLKTISIAVLLSIGTVGWAQARPDRGDGDAARAERGQYRSRDFGQSGRQGQQGEDNSRKQQSRMTPEERRALRRQINEAGQDVYAPRR